MFLKKLKERNPGFIRAAAELHRSGQIGPATYVIDLDAIELNANIIKEKANDLGLSVYPMTKQIGRNPLVAEIMVKDTSGAVAVDIEGAKCLEKNNLPVGHIGHLLQIPLTDIEYVLTSVKPEVITVFSVEKAVQISHVAKKLKVNQDILLRVGGDGCFFYPMQEGGFSLHEIVSAARKISDLDCVNVVGVTSFPALLFNPQSKKVEATFNFDALIESAELLEKNGFPVKQINAPGTTSANVMELLKNKGATHVEPGHGFAGMTPLHAFEDLPEIPAVLWVTEISHFYNGYYYAFGYGFKPDTLACGEYEIVGFAGDSFERIFDKKVVAKDYYPAMDYIIKVMAPEGVSVGDTVIFSFRQQISFSTSKVAILKGVQTGRPELAGVFDRTGNVTYK
jgi:predicted amino acid racemase